MMQQPRRILVTGGTGQQGGGAARHLLERGFTVRALTRNPDGDAAHRLAKLGAEVVKGDLDDSASLERALTGTWEGLRGSSARKRPAIEVEQGERLARLARSSGVQHFVHSSVGSAHRNTGIPHFESKWQVENAVRALGFPIETVLRPVYFMENLLGPWTLRDDKLVSWTAPDTKLQMIAADDIGRFAAHVFEELAKTSSDLAAMAHWFDRVGYDADIPRLRATYGAPLMTLAEWARSKRRAPVSPA